jgi:hypothetical protein
MKKQNLRWPGPFAILAAAGFQLLNYQITHLPVSLLHLLLRLVTVARDDLIFNVFVFLVPQLQWVPGLIDELNLDLAEGAVKSSVGGMVRDGVLVADGLGDVSENLPQLAIEDRLIPAASVIWRRSSSGYRPEETSCCS